MSLVTLGGTTVLAMELHRPGVGRWFALVDLDGVDAPSGPVTIDIADGALKLVGFAERTGVFADRVRLRVEGGFGGLSKEIPARFYQNVPVRILFSDLLGAVGEKLSPKSDADFLNTMLPKWTRSSGPAVNAISSLLWKFPGIGWRTDDSGDGTIWLGRETWPTITMDYDLIDEDPADRRIVIASEDPTLRPGVVLDGRKISRVIARYEAASVRTEAWLEVT